MCNKTNSIISWIIGLLSFMFILNSSAFATTYYMDATNGNDNNNGTSETSAWKTLSKINNTTFSPGDFIAFKRGEKWVGRFEFKSEGAVDNPIVFGAYGTGPKPILTGLEVHDLNWIKIDNNIWKSSTTVSKDPRRIHRNGNEILQASKIDELGRQVPDLIEWYYSDSTLYLYSNTDPNNDIFEYSQYSNIVRLKDKDNLTFQDLDIQGAANAGIEIDTGSNLTFLRLDLGYMSYMGILFNTSIAPSDNIMIDGCNVDAHWNLNYNNGGINFYSQRGAKEGVYFSGTFSNSIIKNSFFKNWHHSGINIWAKPTVPNYINNMKITNNYFTGPNIPYGNRLSFAGNSHHSEISYNTFENMYGGRIQMDGWDNHLHHNYFHNMRGSLIHTGEDGAIRLGNWNGENKNHIIEYNLFKDCYSSTIIVGGTDKPNPGVHDIIIKDNVFDNNTDDNDYYTNIDILSGEFTFNLTIINNNMIAASDINTIDYGSFSNMTTDEFNTISKIKGDIGSGNFMDPNYTLIAGSSETTSSTTVAPSSTTEQQSSVYVIDPTGLKKQPVQ